MVQILNSIADSIHHAMRNPFGLDFEVHNKNIYVPLGSAINCIGYNDYLERTVAAVRGCFALLALATSHDMKERAIACGHLFRAGLEWSRDCEQYLLVLDVAFTIYNIAYRVLYRSGPTDFVQEDAVNG